MFKMKTITLPED